MGEHGRYRGLVGRRLGRRLILDHNPAIWTLSPTESGTSETGADPSIRAVCKHGCVPIPDDSLRSVIGHSPDEREQHRRSLWEYYDRRVTGNLPGLANAHAYWTGLGVTVEVEDIAAEAAQLERLLRELSAVRFVEVGAGPGTFTGYLAGRGIAIDQSRRALDVLRTVAPEVPVIQADATALPVPAHAFDRFFSAHLYGSASSERA